MNAILDEWDRRQSSGKVIDNRHLAGAGLSAVLGVNNPYAFGIAALLIVIGSIAAFMFVTGRWSVNRAPAR